MPTKEQVATAQRFIDLHRNHPAITNPATTPVSMLDATIVNTYVASVELIQSSLVVDEASGA